MGVALFLLMTLAFWFQGWHRISVIMALFLLSLTSSVVFWAWFLGPVDDDPAPCYDVECDV